MSRTRCYIKLSRCTSTFATTTILQVLVHTIIFSNPGHGSVLPEGTARDPNHQWTGNCNILNGLVCGHDIDHFCEEETGWCQPCGVYCADNHYYDDKMCREKCPAWYAKQHRPTTSPTSKLHTTLSTLLATQSIPGPTKIKADTSSTTSVTGIQPLSIPSLVQLSGSLESSGRDYTIVYVLVGVALLLLLALLVLAIILIHHYHKKNSTVRDTNLTQHPTDNNTRGDQNSHQGPISQPTDDSSEYIPLIDEVSPLSSPNVKQITTSSDDILKPELKPVTPLPSDDIFNPIKQQKQLVQSGHHTGLTDQCARGFNDKYKPCPV